MDCEDCRHLTVVGLHNTGPWSATLMSDALKGVISSSTECIACKICVCFFLCSFVCCSTSQQLASVSQGRIWSDNFTCCHIEIQVADQTFYLTQSKYTDTGPTSPSAGPMMPGAWQGSHWSANFEVTDMTRPGKISSQAGFELRTFLFRGGRLNNH